MINIYNRLDKESIDVQLQVLDSDHWFQKTSAVTNNKLRDSQDLVYVHIMYIDQSSRIHADNRIL